MKKSSCVYLCVLVILLQSCTSASDSIMDYFDATFRDTEMDSTYVNFQNIFHVDYDTMYVFSEYSQVEGVRLITGVDDYDERDFLMPRGFLVEDSHQKIILVKSGKIVFDEDTESIFRDSVNIEKEGTFDGAPFRHQARMYASPCFSVKRLKSSSKKDDVYYRFDNVSEQACVTTE